MQKPNKSQKRPKETSPPVLKQAMLRRVSGRTYGSGVLSFPCAPAMLDHYVDQLAQAFAICGRPFSQDDIGRLRKHLEKNLNDGWARSPFSRLEVSYATQEPPGNALDYKVRWIEVSMADRYQSWVDTRKPPLFGAHGDAKVLAVAKALGDPAGHKLLDIGAGTGRNAMALAELGYSCDALEPVAPLVEIMKKDVAERKLSVRPVLGSLFDAELPLEEQSYSVVFLAEVIASHCRGNTELERLLRRATDFVRPGGTLLFNLFLAADGYKPDAMARQLSEVVWTVTFTRRDLAEVTASLPLDQVRDESAYELEKAAAAPGAWPPTGWFEDWAQGLDLFELPAGRAPIELRWIECRRRA